MTTESALLFSLLVAPVHGVLGFVAGAWVYRAGMMGRSPIPTIATKAAKETPKQQRTTKVPKVGA